MKYLALLVFLLLVVGVLIFKYKTAPQINYQSEVVEPAGANCQNGVNGNEGDNFCANYHGGGSKCLAQGAEDTYADGCIKFSPAP